MLHDRPTDVYELREALVIMQDFGSAAPHAVISTVDLVGGSLVHGDNATEDLYSHGNKSCAIASQALRINLFAFKMQVQPATYGAKKWTVYRMQRFSFKNHRSAVPESVCM